MLKKTLNNEILVMMDQLFFQRINVKDLLRASLALPLIWSFMLRKYSVLELKVYLFIFLAWLKKEPWVLDK